MAGKKKLKIDKEALLEFAAKKKDQLFLGVLVLALLGGGYYIYTQTSMSVSQIIDTAKEGGPGGGATAGGSDIVNPEELVTLLTAKRSKAMYQVERNPFGSPEEQLRMRQEVDASYQRGVDLFNNGRYQEAIEQFDRVIQLDVTETRINYPVLPSEYKRRAMQENARSNLDSILTSAQNDINEGDRLAQGNQTEKAIEMYNSASSNLASVIDSDPEGAVIGVENLTKVKTLEQQAFKKFIGLRGKSLLDDIKNETALSRQVVNGQDFIAMMKAAISLQRLQVEIQQIDPNAELVNRTSRTQVNALTTQLQKKIQDNTAMLVNQAVQQFQQAIQASDLVKSREALAILVQARQLNPKDEQLTENLKTFVAQRADLVIQSAQDFAVKQRDIVAKGDYANFDINNRDLFIVELNGLLERSANLDETKRGEVLSALNVLKQLKLPPALTQKYEIRSVESMGNSFKVIVVDKTSSSSKPRTLILREGRPDTSTKIQLKQVDTQEGFVILSRPDYMDAKVPLSKTN
ncbi:MAG: tetratricopeptide repeat protein [Candidatus Hinthialibacter antarcticus]|nr:tetratricopeptide repeat protein [Candidatus Hinthialibacter antarcticus]